MGWFWSFHGLVVEIKNPDEVTSCCRLTGSDAVRPGETPTSETLPAEGRGRRGLWSCRRSEDRGRYRLLTGLLNPGHEAHQRQLGGDLHGGGRGREGASYHHTVTHMRAGPEVCGACQGNRKSVKKIRKRHKLKLKSLFAIDIQQERKDISP